MYSIFQPWVSAVSRISAAPQRVDPHPPDAELLAAERLDAEEPLSSMREEEGSLRMSSISLCFSSRARTISSSFRRSLSAHILYKIQAHTGTQQMRDTVGRLEWDD